MRRIAWAGMTLISTVLCLCVIVLWPRSLWRADTLDYSRKTAESRWPFDYVKLFSLSGSIGISYFRIDPETPRQWSGSLSVASNSDDTLGFYPQYERFGFRWWDYRLPFTNSDGPGRTVGVGVPHWLVIALLAIRPAYAGRCFWMARRAQRRIAAGLCTTCGYDLRASPKSCPECGAAAVANGATTI